MTNIIFLHKKVSLHDSIFPKKKSWEEKQHKTNEKQENLCTTTNRRRKLQFVWFLKIEFPFNVRENCDFIEQLSNCQCSIPISRTLILNSKILGSWTLTLFYIIVIYWVFPHCFSSGEMKLKTIKTICQTIIVSGVREEIVPITTKISPQPQTHQTYKVYFNFVWWKTSVVKVCYLTR